ncbi:MAG: SDR family oxidoreductase [Hyphomicrobiales bacterium]|nr:MAG: SDR family oxidoreductase [Hyphomicrobiales bacterium]
MSRAPSFDLTGQTALVTGASRGIGAALAKGLAAAGAEVIVAARTASALSEVAAEIVSAGGRAHAETVDVADSASVDALFEKLKHDKRVPSILVNNAGAEQVSPALEVTDALWDKIVGVNLKGAFNVARAFARTLNGQPGAIVNLCSLSSEVGIPTAVPYTASKSGLAGTTRALAVEWAPLGIRVNGLGPGYFRTEMTETFFAAADWQLTMLARIPQRRFGELDDLVGAAIFLCAPASAYVTGQILYVDGGYLASI